MNINDKLKRKFFNVGIERFSEGKFKETVKSVNSFTRVFDISNRYATLEASVINSIRHDIDCNSLARNLLVSEPLGNGQIPLYDTGLKRVLKWEKEQQYNRFSFYNSRDQQVVDTYEVSSFNSISYSEVMQREYLIIDRALRLTMMDIINNENIIFLSALNRIFDEDSIFKEQILNLEIGSNISDKLDCLFANYINHLFNHLPNVIQTRIFILMNGVDALDLIKWIMEEIPNRYRSAFENMNSSFDSPRYLLGSYGYYYHFNMRESNVWVFVVSDRNCPRGVAYLLPTGEDLGVFPIRLYPTVRISDDVQHIRLNVAIFEEVGLMIINPDLVYKVQLINNDFIGTVPVRQNITVTSYDNAR